MARQAAKKILPEPIPNPAAKQTAPEYEQPQGMDDGSEIEVDGMIPIQTEGGGEVEFEINENDPASPDYSPESNEIQELDLGGVGEDLVIEVPEDSLEIEPEIEEDSTPTPRGVQNDFNNIHEATSVELEKQAAPIPSIAPTAPVGPAAPAAKNPVKRPMTAQTPAPQQNRGVTSSRTVTTPTRKPLAQQTQAVQQPMQPQQARPVRAQVNAPVQRTVTLPNQVQTAQAFRPQMPQTTTTKGALQTRTPMGMTAPLATNTAQRPNPAQNRAPAPAQVTRPGMAQLQPQQQPLQQQKTPARTIGTAPSPILAPPPVAQIIHGKMPDMGPLDHFMKDPGVTEIMVNDLRNVIIEKEGKLMYSGFTYTQMDSLNQLVRNILETLGKVLTPDQPYLDTILPDGSRINIVTAPLTLHGPCITIRKFPARQFTVEHLTQHGMMDRRIAQFLIAAVQGKLNLIICGGTGCGKTTLLNALTAQIPPSERVIMIEDIPELTVNHYNSVKLQTKPSSPTSPSISARDLVVNSLRMRPDRIIVGECRRGEAFDILQAMNTGHSGSMTTLHANSPRDALARFETLCMIAGTDLPFIAIRKQMASAFDLLIQIKRFRSGRRRLTQISEVTGIQGETITLQDIFLYEMDARAATANSDVGQFKATGFVPSFVERLRESGIEFPPNYFA
jgi:Flp pilus assembly CpaF family ATPase